MQDDIKLFDNLQMTAGVRSDYSSDWGVTTNPRVGFVWELTSSVSSKFLYGRAFRAPSFGEIYWVNNPALVGNENIKPEKIDTIELGLNFHPVSSFHFSQSIYWYKASNLIQTVDSSIGKQYQNIGRQDGAGIELEFGYQINPDILLAADYAYRWTRDGVTKKSVVGVAKHIGHIKADLVFAESWSLNSEVLMVADTPRAASDTRKKVASYATINAALKFTLNEKLMSSLIVRNILDKKYFEPSDSHPINDFPMEGQSIYAELKYNL